MRWAGCRWARNTASLPAEDLPPMLARLLRFGLTGLANSAVGWAVIFGGLWAGLSGLVANAAGYAVGLVVLILVVLLLTGRI